MRRILEPHRPGPPVHDDLVRREFTAKRPNQLWLTDITEHPTARRPLHDRRTAGLRTGAPPGDADATRSDGRLVA